MSTSERFGGCRKANHSIPKSNGRQLRSQHKALPILHCLPRLLPSALINHTQTPRTHRLVPFAPVTLQLLPTSPSRTTLALPTHRQRPHLQLLTLQALPLLRQLLRQIPLLALTRLKDATDLLDIGCRDAREAGVAVTGPAVGEDQGELVVVGVLVLVQAGLESLQVNGVVQEGEVCGYFVGEEERCGGNDAEAIVVATSLRGQESVYPAMR